MRVATTGKSAQDPDRWAACKAGSAAAVLGWLHGSQREHSTPADQMSCTQRLLITACRRAFGRETRSLKACYELMQAGYKNGEPELRLLA